MVAPAPADTEANARSRLAAALQKLERTPPVLDALTPEIRADLAAVVNGLSEADRATLASREGRIASERPLLHLAAGGTSDVALLAAATTSRAADDLVFARRASKRDELGDLLPAQRELVRRAATRWLQNQSGALAGPGKLQVALFEAIDQAALALDRVDLRRLAREAAVELEPTPTRRLALARAYAWDLDIARARGALSSAGSAAGAADLVDELRETKELIDTAEQARVSAADAKDVDALVRQARALLRLHRYSDAGALLDPVRSAAPKHLALATALANAASHGATCPGLPPIAGNARLCALAWQKDAPSAAAIGVVRQAWQSGGGRDANAVEAYIGLVHVVPWLYSTIAEQLAPSSRPFIERLRALQQVTRETGEFANELSGLSLFVDTLATGVDLAAARQADRPARIPEPAQRALEERARELLQKQPGSRFAESGALAVAALLAQERDVQPLLAALPDTVTEPNRLPRALLGLWAAVARERGEEAAKARASISHLLTSTGLDSLERTGLVLLMAEADAALGRGPDAFSILGRIGLQLAQADAPGALRSRAAIDAAGAAVQRGDRQTAAALLEPFLSARPGAPPGAEAELSGVARAYFFALRAAHATGIEREDFRAQFTQAIKLAPPTLPSSLRAWQELWRIDIEYALAVARCQAARPCRELAQKQRAAAAARILEGVGAETARFLRRDVLASGTVELSFHFSAENGLVPLIGFEPVLMSAGLGVRSPERH